jgi:putative hemolysin
MSLFFPLLLLLGTTVLTACNTALHHLGKFKTKELLRSSHPPLLFFRSLLKYFLAKHEWENLYFSLSISKHICQLGYAVSAIFYLFKMQVHVSDHFLDSPPELLGVAALVITLSLFFDFLARLSSTLWSRLSLKITAPIASFYLCILFPLVGALLQLTRSLMKEAQVQEEDLLTDKSKIREMIRESELQQHLDPSDQKLISSFVHFKERVAKEIMVPRVDIYSLAADTTLREAVQLFAQEGYSRIPIYGETLDEIVGVVLYKDILKSYAHPTPNFELTLTSIAKPVLYAPENKKITQLLQEFRNKQIHMAIIVDEYGGTEGIVTIEDILEELVGEIEDEYDIGEEHPFYEVPGGGWIIDTKMTIHDIEEQLGVKIPPHPEYETLGGYIYHCAGTIPPKGWRLSHDAFDLEVLSSNERSIKKVKIWPRADLTH